MKLSDYVAEFVAAQGVGHVFMIPGGGAMHLNESFGNHPRLRYICNLHEQACAISADAYAQARNDLGVFHVTTGPGGTNALTGLAASFLDSIPILAISGQVKTKDLKRNLPVRQIGFQELDIISIVRPITKYAVLVDDPGWIRYHLEKAVYLARSERPGPVWLDIPLDVQAAFIHPQKLRSFHPPSPSKTSSRLKSQVQQLVKNLKKAHRPVLLIGNGVRLGGAVRAFKQILKKVPIPVLLTWKAMDLLAERHPLYCGRPGGSGQRGANFIQQKCDFILAVGARLDMGQVAYNPGNFAPLAKKYIVDIDPAELAKLKIRQRTTIRCGAKLFLSVLLKELNRKAVPSWGPWLQHARALHRRYPVCLASYWKEKSYVNNYVFLEVLAKLMRPGDLLVPGSSGQCSEITMQAFQVKQGQRILNSQGLGSMGFGIAAPIGACLGLGGKRRTVGIDGDGGFVMNIQELETLRRLNLSVKIFVLNNQGYGSIRASQRNYFSGHYVASTKDSGLTLPNLNRVTSSLRIPFFRISCHQNLETEIKKVLKHPGPAVCEIKISPNQPTVPRTTSKIGISGKIVTLPMDDMSPLLCRHEVKEARDWKNLKPYVTVANKRKNRNTNI